MMLDKWFGKRNKIDAGKAALAAGALAAGLSAATPAYGQEDAGGYDSSGYYDTATEQFPFDASHDALGTVDFLNRDFGTSLTPTQGQVENIKIVVDNFVHAHPVTESTQPRQTQGAGDDFGDTTVIGPLADLQAAVEAKAGKLNPILLVLLRKELDDRVKQEAGQQ
jgi:hypothetical protein